MQGFLGVAQNAHRIVTTVCCILLFSFFLAQIVAIALRYLFAIGFVELQNFISYGFAIFSVLAIPLALRTDKHVRVDVLRDRMTPALMRRVDVIAIIVLLLPVFGMTLWKSLPIVSYSWSILEGSRDTGGLPGYFVVLTALPVLCVLMIVQGIAVLLDRSIIHGPAPDEND